MIETPTLIEMLAPSLDAPEPSAILTLPNGHVAVVVLNHRPPGDHELWLACAVHQALERGVLVLL